MLRKKNGKLIFFILFFIIIIIILFKEMDLEQAQELSKHIVSDIINQAVRRLNDDIKNNKHLKREYFLLLLLFHHTEFSYARR